MKKASQIIFLIILSLFSVSAWAQPISYEWGHAFGANTESCGYASVTDAAGNVFTVGTFTAAANFSPTGTSVLTSKGKKDIFIQCMSPTGTLNWVNSFGGPGDDIPKSICLVSGYLYITGTFEASATFGSGTLISAGLTDGFLVKMLSSGGSITSLRIGGSGNDEINSVTSAGTGKICVTGSFEGFVDMDGSLAGTSFATSNGLHDIFIEELNISGLTLVWAKTIGGTGEDYGKSVACDISNNIYVTGSFEDAVDMDPGLPFNNIVSFGASDIFIEKLNSSGSFLWATNTGDVNNDDGKCIKTDAVGNVFVYGNYTGSPDFDPGFTIYSLPSNGGIDIFIQKLDSLGNFINAFTQGGSFDDDGSAFILDAGGNIYCTGSFQGTVDFNPTAGTSFVTSTGFDDMFIQKLDPAFNLTYINSLKGIGNGASNGITSDASGNIFTTGYIADTTDMDPGTGVTNITTYGVNKYYIHKLNNTSIYQWAKTITTDPAAIMAMNTVKHDIYGNSYNAGYFQFEVDFDPGPGSFMINPPYRDPFVQKLDPAGNLLWAVTFQSPPGSCCIGGGSVTSMALDSSGNLFVLGNFDQYSLLDYDPGSGVVNIPATSEGVFIVKLDSSGNLVWVKVIQGSSPSVGEIGISISSKAINNQIALDKNGNIYYTSNFMGTVDFNPGAGVFNLTCTGDEDIFVCKLDSLGNFVWAKKVGNNIDREDLSGVFIDSFGNPIIWGRNANTADLDPGTAVYSVGRGGFILKLDSSGNFQWAKSFPTPTNILSITSAKADILNNIYFTGNFRGTIDFDPGPGVYSLSSSSGTNEDAIVEKLDASGNFIWAKTFGNPIGRDEPWDLDVDMFSNVYIAGYYDRPVDFDPGPSSFIITPTSASAFIQKLNANGDFVWAQSVTAIPPGSYSDASSISVNSDGGDIFVAGVLDGKIDLDPTSGTDIANVFGDYSGFIFKLNQCSDNITQTQLACNDFTYGGITYTNSGIYGQVLGTSFTGCDSTITFDLTINNSNTAVTQSGNILTATQSGASYQWINCTTGLPISGETAQSYSATASGSYAVEIDLAGCVDTSTCIPLIYTGIPPEEQPLVNVYPSPFTDNFTLEYFDNKHQPIQLEVSNILGQVVYKQELMSDSKQQVVLNDLQSGMYIVKMYTEFSFSQKHIIKE